MLNAIICKFYKKGGKSMLVTTDEILQDAHKNKYAVGAFNFSNMENLHAIVEAADTM
ncbi:MAG: class II fructose-bisphosphate aldolase, partial [Oscillospiraceae bacterium]